MGVLGVMPSASNTSWGRCRVWNVAWVRVRVRFSIRARASVRVRVGVRVRVRG